VCGCGQYHLNKPEKGCRVFPAGVWGVPKYLFSSLLPPQAARKKESEDGSFFLFKWYWPLAAKRPAQAREDSPAVAKSGMTHKRSSPLAGCQGWGGDLTSIGFLEKGETPKSSKRS
jgi:hypothetical protein